MKLFIVIVEDRHTDVECYPFDTSEVAIKFAKKQARLIATHDGAWPNARATIEQCDGWLYAARCSSEGDYVHVVEKELNATE